MIDIASIISATEKRFYLVEGSLTSVKRTAILSVARNVAMFLARELTNYSLKEVGNAFKKDHTSVIYAVKRVNKLLISNEEVKNIVEGLRKELTCNRWFFSRWFK